MRLPFLFLLLSSLTLSAAPFGGTTRTAFGKLKEALLADANNSVPGEGTAERRLSGAQMQIRRLEQALEQGTDAWTTLEQIGDGIQSAYKSTAVRETWGVFLKAAGEESQRVRQSVEEQVATLISRLKTLVGKAAQPEDFDEIIQELDPAAFTGRNEGSQQYRKVESARAFAMAWQEYLSAKAAGDSNRLSQSISQLLGSSANAGQFIPRSKLLQEQSLARESGVPASRINGILDQVKAPADLAAAIHEINQLMMTSRNSGGSEQSLTYIVTALTSFQRVLVEAGAGLGVRLELMNGPLAQQMTFGNSEAAMTRIRTLVLRFLIAGFVAQATTGEIRSDETIEAYTKRALKNALSEGDLDTLARLSSFSPGSRPMMSDYGSAYLDSTWRQATSQSLTSCFAARNFEAAADPLSAVMAWHAALKSGSIYTPAEYIGKRLESIKAAHPEAYAKAMEKALNPLPAFPAQGR